MIVHEGRTEPVGRQIAPDVGRRHRRPHPRAAGVRMTATVPCEVALIPADDFRRLTLAHPPVHERVMKQMQPVMSRLAGAEQNRERLESLGTMAAGLAHELNNPAAAVKRAASDLADALDVIGATLGEFVEAGVERADAERLVALQREALARAEEHDELDGLDAADAEDAMLERLEALRGRRGLAPGRAARGGGHRRGVADGGPRARGPGDRRRPALGGRVADRARPRRRPARLGLAHGRPRRGRSRPTPTWTAASWCRSTSTRA